jgi:UDP-N-acetyl-D-mannosaminuronic acid dehydrogenase
MKSVVIIGLGYIGLPTSALIASNGLKVYGVDINQKVVDTINRGEIHIVEPELDNIVKRVVKKGLLSAGTKAKESDVYLIVVPTPFKGNHEPDISYIEQATKEIIPLLKAEDLYIIESTSPVGTTDKMKDFIFSERPDLEGRLNVAYCPERVLPGNIMHELVHNDRVIGGIDKKSTKSAKDFYNQFVKGELHGTNARTAEMCKLTENASRDVQIAFANELSLICDKASINVWELIKLANKHPRVNILKPGCGVGGHCIAVDPYFITHHFPIESKIIRAAREINNYKAFWCVEKIQNEILKFELENQRRPSIAICGLSFKPNIDDLRESPAVYVAEKIKQSYDEELTYFVEPNIQTHSKFEISLWDKAKNEADLCFVLVAHQEFNKEISGKLVSFVELM